MAGFYGGDTEQMRRHAQACTRGAQRLSDLVSTAQSAIDGAAWEGPDADAFRERWHGTVMPDLLARGEDVDHRARELEQHAEQQDQTSGGDDGGFFDIIADLLPGGPFGPLLPLPAFPGDPLGPSRIDALQHLLGIGSVPGDGEGPYFYGDEEYGPGGAASDSRPVGAQSAGDSHWDGREIENDAGYVDGYANTRASYGANTTTDAEGNTTRTIGARAGAEIGYEEQLNLPGGFTLGSDGRLGAEAYSEAGVTYGPDGFSAGASGSAGVYGDISATLAGPYGASQTIGANGYAGAEAHANAYSHVTRNEDGDVNGWTFGADAGAFAGAKAEADFSGTSPGGWFSSSASAGVEAGAGVGGSFGGTVSTDEVGVAVGGDVAAALGVNADLSFSVHPNEIVNDITPGDYDLDDAIGDASGAFEGAKDAVGDAVSGMNPFD
ncbi:WXG100 family type VII secretion target [Brachybacterium sacelli]|uniref:WXG100 family type VII secretion target n=1 Tax=Brachybacterium sacelli TaxID=173364 RepID=A0ABS4X162_9MICO|nr:hypothetical protein [Brachybacterium sacelli]MBP2382076.1 hypothetical protein [Brachybacterium sacelli]